MVARFYKENDQIMITTTHPKRGEVAHGWRGSLVMLAPFGADISIFLSIGSQTTNYGQIVYYDMCNSGVHLLQGKRTINH